jgi:hypothetical protein
MSMTPISDNGLTYSIASLATLATVLTADVLHAETWNQAWSDMNLQRVDRSGIIPPASGLVPPTPKIWADMVAASPVACSSQADPKTIRAVIALGLQGGGMASGAATDTAERLYRAQLNRHMDFLAASIVAAVVAAGV